MNRLEKSWEGRQIVVSPCRRRVSLSCLIAQRSAMYKVVFRYNKQLNSFRYNKQLIAQLVRRHEDLSHAENSCLTRASSSGDMNFLGGTNLHVSHQAGQ